MRLNLLIMLRWSIKQERGCCLKSMLRVMSIVLRACYRAKAFKSFLDTKQLGPEPYFVEMGHIVGAPIPAERQHEMEEYVASCIKYLRLTTGVFHLELKVNDAGPFIIEIAGRLPGDHICDLIEVSFNVDLAKLMIQSHLGEVVAVESLISRCVSGIRYFMEPFDSDAVRCEEGCLAAESGPSATQHLDTFMARAGFVMFRADTQEGLEEKLGGVVGPSVGCGMKRG